MFASPNKGWLIKVQTEFMSSTCGLFGVVTSINSGTEREVGGDKIIKCIIWIIFTTEMVSAGTFAGNRYLM